MITGPEPKPSARKVAISRVRRATELYIVLSAPNSAPNAIMPAMNTPNFWINATSIEDWSARNSAWRSAFTLSCGFVVTAFLNCSKAEGETSFT